MPKNQLGMQISYFRYADMDFFKMPHIQIRYLGKDPVFEYDCFVLFIDPCAFLVPLSRLLLPAMLIFTQPKGQTKGQKTFFWSKFVSTHV